MNLIDVKLSLDQATIDFLEIGALLKNTSKSGFLRMIPSLLTPEERHVIERLRLLKDQATVTTATVGRDYASDD